MSDERIEIWYNLLVDYFGDRFSNEDLRELAEALHDMALYHEQQEEQRKRHPHETAIEESKYYD